MQGTGNKINSNLYYIDAFENYIEFSCFTDQFLTGMDLYGEPDDLIAFDECIECGMYENIKNMEALKHAMNAEYLKHVTIAKHAFCKNDKFLRELGLFGIINFDIDSWIDHVKLFYITILSNTEMFDLMYEHNVSLEEIESSIEMMIRLEDFIVENFKEKENNFWN